MDMGRRVLGFEFCVAGVARSGIAAPTQNPKLSSTFGAVFRLECAEGFLRCESASEPSEGRSSGEAVLKVVRSRQANPQPPQTASATSNRRRLDFLQFQARC